METVKKSKRALSFEDYLRQLADTSQPLSVASLYRLSDLGEEELALLELAWPSLPDRRRREVTRHLVDLTESNFEVEFESLFWIGLNDSDSEVREAAVDGLWVSEDVLQISSLIRLMLSDPAVNVRAAAAGSLARFVLLGELGKISQSHQAAIVDVLNALHTVIATESEDIEVRRRAVEAIAYSGGDDVPDIIQAAYNSPDERMRISAMCGMGRSADNQWKNTIIRELESPNPEMRYEAARAAGELEVRKAVPLLATLLDDHDREVQEMAVWAIGQIGDKRARDLLRKCYEEGEEWLSDAAGEALEEMMLMHSVDLPLFDFDPLDFDEEELDFYAGDMSNWQF